MNRFIEVVRALKRRTDSVVACPVCGSLRVGRSTGMDGWMLPPLYLCNECGYAGRLVVEIDRESLSRKKDERRNSNVPRAEH